MRIRITRGTYGFRKNGNVVEKTKDDPAFEVDDEEGRRLIDLNVAEIVNIAGEIEDPMGDPGMTETENSEDTLDPFSIEALGHKSKEELIRLAEEFGIKKNGSKTELAERICQYGHLHGDDDLIDADDAPFETEDVPKLTAEDPE